LAEAAMIIKARQNTGLPQQNVFFFEKTPPMFLVFFRAALRDWVEPMWAVFGLIQTQNLDFWCPGTRWWPPQTI
jgi:hypothetical protein